MNSFWITGGSTPCLALFKPYWMIDGEKFSFGPEREDEAAGFWRRRERLHQAVLENRLPDLEAYLAGGIAWKRVSMRGWLRCKTARLPGKAAGIMAWALAAEEELLAGPGRRPDTGQDQGVALF